MPARGAGMTMRTTRELIVAADDTGLGHPGIDAGVIPAIHDVHLPRQISRYEAFEFLFESIPTSVPEAVPVALHALRSKSRPGRKDGSLHHRRHNALHRVGNRVERDGAAATV